ncbi:MAG: N-acetylmuramoyl-L-alanine amidase [Treponema sp.]|nr:N-acetylmuramoyl-L-alanine amidase [Treponema sp.]
MIYSLVFITAGLSAQSPADLSLDETLAQLNFPRSDPAELRWDPLFGSGVLSIAGHEAAFSTAEAGGAGYLILDSRDLYTVPAPSLVNGNLYFPGVFVSTLREALETRIADESFQYKIAAIIIDPGHGGKDPGAIGEHQVDGQTLRAVEKDITLEVSRLLYERLRAAYPDKRILMTRTGDTYPSLDDRVAIANAVSLAENEAIIYISIHANASLNSSARGYEVWYLSSDYRRELVNRDQYADNPEIIPILNDMLEEEFTNESIAIAQAIIKRYGETLGAFMPSRGIKEEDWFVVRNARMPSVLIELGFVTNLEDALLLTGAEGLRQIVDALYKGIGDFISAFEGSSYRGLGS